MKIKISHKKTDFVLFQNKKIKGNCMLKKHWDYEDDYDNVDYKAKGYGYWYGKYIPQEEIDNM